jgi:hypothetical protein
VEERIIEREGVERLITDNEVIMRDRKMEEMRKRHEVGMYWTVSDRHQANPVEARVKTVKMLIKSLLMEGIG